MKIIFAFLFLTLTFSLSAYDAIGHRVIASIAYNNLSCKARRQVDKVVGKRGIIYTSTWADEVRSDKKYNYSYPWHYQNLKDSLATTDLQNLLKNTTAEGEHLFYAVEMLTERLKKDKTDAEALKFIIHFMGDLHQPLHLGRLEDLGGNKIKVQWFGKEINIHSLWDTYMIESKKMSYSEYSNYLQDKFKLQKKQFKNYTLLTSVEAGYQLRTKLYNFELTNSNSYLYIYQFSDNLDEMLYRGGIQLAKKLNEVYK